MNKIKTISFFVLLISTIQLVGQSFSYQGVLRSATGQILDSQNVGVQFKILEGGASGNVVYEETHTTTTNEYGVVNLSVGSGNPVSGTLSGINWSTQNHWLEVAVDISGGTIYTVLGSSQLQAVPYASYAATSGDKVFSTINNVTSNAEGNIINDDFVFGSTSLDNDPNTTDDNSKIFFDKSKAAFRVGRLKDLDLAEPEDSGPGDQWNEVNIGENSIAMGYGSLAAGNNSVAIGEFNRVNSGSFNSMAIGGSNEITDSGISFAIGQSNTITNSGSMAFGFSNTSSGLGAIAMGFVTNASSYSQMSVGLNSTEVVGSKDSFIATDRLFVIGNGISVLQRRDALVMLKNGNTTLNGQLTLDADNTGTGRAYTLPAQDGSANQVMTTDGAGNVTWRNASSGGVFSTTSNVTSNVTGSLTTDDFVFGSSQLNNDTSTTTDDFRFFFDKSKGAFRAGRVFNADWDEANLGQYSIALGRGNLASENASFAVGESNVSSGSSSVAMGEANEATNYAAFAAGYNSIASGDSSVAMGDGSKATAQDAVAIGESNVASAISGTAIGNRTTADSYSQVSLGMNNTTLNGNSNVFVETDRLFVVGNGVSSIFKSDALVMLKNGNTTLNGQLTLDGDNTGTGRAYTLPAQDGTANQVMTTDGSGNVTWSNYGLEAVSSPTFGSGWQNYSVVHGNGFEDARYYVDNGRVYLGGLIRKTSVITSGEVMITLPIGYRPQKQRIFTVSTEAGIVRIDVAANGNVVFNGPSHNGGQNWVSLDGISFRID
ncbi:hypothetical protein [Tenacibaculum sp. 190524A05c]|uniref:hypothetical protein n=1 Tax=Tenacibaculum platacis TaxID=3137852 RepID=UPI0031FB25CA